MVVARTSLSAALGRPSANQRRRHTTGKLVTLAMFVQLGMFGGMLLAGCAQLGIGDGAQMQGEWVLVDGEDRRGTIDLTPAPVLLTVEGTAVSGVAACNSYGGRVIGRVDFSDELPVRIVDLFQTEMACTDDDVMVLEGRYLDALALVTDGLRIDDDTMVLVGDNVRLEFDLLIEG